MKERKKQIRNMLKAEIILAAGRLVRMADDREFDKLLEDFHRLYRKIAAWEYLRQTENESLAATLLTGSAPQNPKPEKTPEKPKTEETEKVSGKSPLPQTNKSEENIITKHKDLLEKSARPVFREKDQTPPSTPSASPAAKPAGRTVPLRIGLADKIALLNNLFDKNADAYNDFIRQVESSPTYDEALAAVQRVKEQFDWDGKDEYEFRLLQLIQAKFA